jgi:hypothetical protein
VRHSDLPERDKERGDRRQKLEKLGDEQENPGSVKPLMHTDGH